VLQTKRGAEAERLTRLVIESLLSQDEIPAVNASKSKPFSIAETA
jgi:hypothetical protein